MPNPDFLDMVTARRAETDPTIVRQWAAMKVMLDLRGLREGQGLTQADVAARMGLPLIRIAEIERRPWSASFGRILAYAEAVGASLGASAAEARVAA